jgi:hypothetical protein
VAESRIPRVEASLYRLLDQVNLHGWYETHARIPGDRKASGDLEEKRPLAFIASAATQMRGDRCTSLDLHMSTVLPLFATGLSSDERNY